jgi:hypothetical protein
MKLKLAFLSKAEISSKIRINLDIENLINEVLDLTLDEKIEIDGTDIKVDYKINSNILCLDIKTKPATSAKELSNVYKTITRGNHRKDFNIILVKDEVSEYYIEKIVLLMNSFERLLRELIYLIVINEYGTDWISRLDEQVKNDLKSKGLKESDIIEEGLNELTLNQVENFLFGKYYDATSEEILISINEKLSSEDVDIPGIKSMIENHIPKSLWERLFQENVGTCELDDKLKEVRKFRNKIAHNKKFHIDDYTNCRKLLKGLNKQLAEAITRVENNNYDNILFSSVLHNLSDSINAIFTESMKRNVLVMKKARLQWQEVLNPVHDQMETLRNAMSNVLKNIELPKIKPSTLSSLSNIIDESDISSDENDGYEEEDDLDND